MVTPPGCILGNRSDMVQLTKAIAYQLLAHPTQARWFLKIDRSQNAQGLAMFDVSGMQVTTKLIGFVLMQKHTYAHITMMSAACMMM